MFWKNKFIAFTLAEVLITLGIIGVVAAITIPTLITNNRAKKMHTQLLRANSIIQQAALLAKRDDVDLDDVINNNKYEEFEKYFKNGNCLLPKNAQEAKYKNYSGNKFASAAAAETLTHSYCLFDGMVLWFAKNNWFNTGSFLAIDINGWTEKPNRYGQDVFFWYYDSATQMVVPIGEGTFSNGENNGYDFWTNCPGRAQAEQGISCTKKALQDESYFKKLPK